MEEGGNIFRKMKQICINVAEWEKKHAILGQDSSIDCIKKIRKISNKISKEREASHGYP
jgi:hypothetical protein